MSAGRPSDVTLSGSDLDGLQEVARALLSPLDYETVDAWRAEVNALARELLGADMATFLLPAEEVEALYSEQIDTDFLREYSIYDRQFFEETDLWRHQVSQRVWRRDTLTRRLIPDLEETAYWNEFVVEIRGYDSLGASVPVEGTDRPATLFFHHERPTGPKFGLREEAILRLLYPALVAGVESWQRLADTRGRLGGVLDSLAVPAQLRDGEGRELHRNRALRSLLEEEPERKRVEAALDEVAGRLTELARNQLDPASLPRGSRTSVRVVTDRGPHRISGVLVRPEMVGRNGGSSAVVLTVRGPVRRLPSPREIRARTSLTAREAEVAILLARRRTNDEIAGALVISPHTARHHTEHVLRKLGLDSRRKVRAALLELGGAPGNGAAPAGP